MRFSMLWRLPAEVLEAGASISASSGGSELRHAIGIPKLEDEQEISGLFCNFLFFRVLVVKWRLYCSSD